MSYSDLSVSQLEQAVATDLVDVLHPVNHPKQTSTDVVVHDSIRSSTSLIVGNSLSLLCDNSQNAMSSNWQQGIYIKCI